MSKAVTRLTLKEQLPIKSLVSTEQDKLQSLWKVGRGRGQRVIPGHPLSRVKKDKPPLRVKGCIRTKHGARALTKLPPFHYEVGPCSDRETRWRQMLGQRPGGHRYRRE